MGANTQRLQSLDALRGFDMFWIIGWGKIWSGLALLTGWPVLDWWASQMIHPDWSGFTFYDTIFPLFLFIAGISFPFSFAKNKSKGVSTGQLYYMIFKRMLVLVFLGLIYNGLLKLNFNDQRYASVLGRIGLAWGFAALIFINTKLRGRIIWCAALLIFYWLLLALVPAPDYPDAPRFSIEGNIACYIDRMFLPGKMSNELYDALGLLGVIPATANALLGMFAGELVMSRKEGLSGKKKTVCLLVAGVAMIVIALLWNEVFPIHKKLWTSSFVCLTVGMGLIFFSLFYFLIDVLEYRRWPFFFTVIGMNSITIYLAQSIINFNSTSQFIFGGFIGLFPDSWEGFLDASAYLAVCWFFLYFLYRQKIFLKV